MVFVRAVPRASPSRDSELVPKTTEIKEGENGADVDEDLAGTWTLESTTVTFDQSGDPFIRDVPFTAERNRLSAEGTFNGVIVRAVLTK